ncbi:MAG: ABC transporter permease [Kibdelosporangium sp.]
MTRYLSRRVAQAVFVLWAAFTLSFVVLYLLPGDPVAIMLNGGAGVNQSNFSPEQIASLRAEFGLDKPVVVQYLDQLRAAAGGDFGRSVAGGRQVTELIVAALPNTLQIAGAGLLLAIVLGAAAAILGTLTRVKWLGQVLLSLPALGISLPVFWVGLVLLQVVSFQWGLLPAFGNDGIESLILPAITIALPVAAQIGQVLARSIQTALAEPYIETARAKGAGRVRVHLRHGLRNAVVPALALSAVILGQLIAGAVVVETVFSRDGIGRITASAVSAQDIPVVQGIVVFSALVFVVVNLIVDLISPLLDPRITLRRLSHA